MADRAKVFDVVIESKFVFMSLNSTSKERFTLNETTHFITMKLSRSLDKNELIMIDLDMCLKISTKVLSMYHSLTLVACEGYLPHIK